MNRVTEEILEYYAVSTIGEDSEYIIKHYGMPRRSGRYPWGSGEDPYQHGSDFLSRVNALKDQGWTETAENIKNEFGEDMTVSRYRMEKKWAADQRRMYDVATAKRLKDKEGLGNTEIGKRMGVNESTVRSWLNEDSEVRMNQARKTADIIKKNIDEKGMIDVGKGVNVELGVSNEMLNQALFILEKEGYPTYKGGIPQVTNKGKQTNQRVVCPPGTEHKDIYNYDQIHTMNDYTSHDGGETFKRGVQYPKSMDSKRLMVRYAEDGGIEKDGIIELRRNVPDLSLGDARYSQVRILVDDKKYLKGMAVYSDNMPDGVDVIFNTNKSKNVAKLDTLKDIKNDPDNPFGSLIMPKGQSYYIDKNGKEQLSLINKRADQGDWDEWKNGLPSQFLSKQALSMAKKQLNIAKADKLAEFDDIMNLTNPTIKKHFLNKFADNCDKAAVELKAASLPGQKYHVIIPLPTLKDSEIYAPNYENGTKLALIRYPHGGTFEIPILTVNNKNKVASDLIGSDSIDAVCINSKVAERLSGADFDGDTVMCIPTHDRMGKVKITSTAPLEGLVGFDPKLEYGASKIEKDADGIEHYYRGDREYQIMKKTDTEMGKISNLITDMTLTGGATNDELERAVRHSMVVIDAEKHKLDYKKSEMDNNIAALRRKYQPHYDENGNIVGGGGASTLISRSKGEDTKLKTQGSPKINQKGKSWYDPSKPEGALIYKTADDLYYPVRKYDKDTGLTTIDTIDGRKITYDANDPKEKEKYDPVGTLNEKTGKIIFGNNITNKAGDIQYKVGTRTEKTTRMANTEDANTLVSDAKHPIELAYADYANYMKTLANRARKESVYAGKIPYSAEAKEKYKVEVARLMAELNEANKNAIKERAAQRKANIDVAEKIELDPDLKPKDIKKLNQQAITRYRTEVGSISRRDRNINISDKEWEAIQAGAISESKLIQILNNTDIDKLRERAMPKNNRSLTNGQINRIKAMSDTYTIGQLASMFGVSTSTISKYLNS